MPIFITSLVNDAGVSDKESLVVGRWLPLIQLLSFALVALLWLPSVPTTLVGLGFRDGEVSCLGFDEELEGVF